MERTLPDKCCLHPKSQGLTPRLTCGTNHPAYPELTGPTYQLYGTCQVNGSRRHHQSYHPLTLMPELGLRATPGARLTRVVSFV
uniref:Uncharacterized protein n=1 Tax=Tanacetum cinerariifolium TaxID=118510 RepID=A0A699KJG1_TANCI|nr:hypothetical protein [Tanacetum cinerariifolium]